MVYLLLVLSAVVVIVPVKMQMHTWHKLSSYDDVLISAC